MWLWPSAMTADAPAARNADAVVVDALRRDATGVGGVLPGSELPEA